MKKRSLVFLVSFTLFVSLAAISCFFYLRDIESEYKVLTQQRTNRLVQLLTQINSLETSATPTNGKNTRSPAAQNDIDKITEALLDKAHEARDIDFYIVQRNGEVIKSVNTGPLSDGQKQTLGRLNEVQIFENVAVASTPSGDITVSAGFNRNWGEFRKRAFMSLVESAMFELTVIVALVAFLLFYFSRDIMKLVRRLELGVSQYVDLKPISRESDRIIKTLQNFEERVTQMESSQQHFKNQLFSAITHELNSKKTPPYDFACTMVRVDLNGYSELNRKMDPAQFSKVVDHLFVECMAIINRCGGFMSEYLGDELIFYFKDEQWPRSALVAVGCVTQMNKVARALSEQYSKVLPFDLVFKSALSHGNLSVRKGARELEISGFPFIESVRILKEIKERTNFMIVGSPTVAQLLRPFVNTHSYMVADLKGIGTLEIFQILVQDDLVKILELQNYEALDRYRDAESLVKMMQWMESKIATDKSFLLGKMRPLVMALQKMIVRPHPDSKLEQECRKLIEALIKVDAQNHVTSTLLSLIGRMIVPEQVSPQLRTLLLNLNRHDNPRVRANAVEAMGRLGLSKDLEPPGVSEHNRVVANFMVATGTREFTKDLTHKLGAMIAAKDEALRASALYATGEIMQFHLKRNPIHFRSSEVFQSFMKEALRCLYDDSEMVRRQALKMAAKVDDPHVAVEIERYRLELIEKSVTDRLAEIKEHYDELSAAAA